MGRITEVVKILLILNVIVFFGTMALPEHLRSLGGMYFPLSEGFKPYQIVTHMFMHGGFRHLLFNMLTLFFLGPMVEQALGPKRFLVLYFLSGIGATILHMGINWFEYTSIINIMTSEDVAYVKEVGFEVINNNQIFKDRPVLNQFNSILNGLVWGASGAISGIVIGFATIFPNLKLMLLFFPVPIKAKYLVGASIAYTIIAATFGWQQGVAHWAHLGGAIVGFILVRFIWKLQSLR